MSLKNFIVAILLGVALAAGVFVASRMQTPDQPLSALIIPEPTELPEFSLLDQDGNVVNRDSFAGQWDLLFFGFTHCPDICPATLQMLAAAQRELADAGLSPVPRIVLVSVDPERDTPALIGEYVNYFGEGNLGVTGELPELDKLTRSLGIFYQKVASDDDNYNVDHSAVILLLNPEGRFAALFSSPHTVANFVHDLPIIMGMK